MTQAAFREQITTLVAQLAHRALDDELDDWLNRQNGQGSSTYQALRQSCETGVAEGGLCQREGGGIRYGRVFKPADGRWCCICCRRARSNSAPDAPTSPAPARRATH